MNKGETLISLILGLGLAIALLVALREPPMVRAASFTIDTLVDEYDGSCSDDCSLRDAIILANANGQPDTIILGSGIYTLTLSNGSVDSEYGDLDISGSDALTITGAGPGKTIISANGIDRVIEVHDTTGSTLIANLTIRDGNPSSDGGGGIWNQSVLTVENVVVFNNSAGSGGGLENWNDQGGPAFLTVISSTIVSNTSMYAGGGINVGSYAHLTVISSTIRENECTMQHGGAIASSGFVTVENSALIYNTAEYVGAVNVNGHDSTTLISSTTVSSNTSRHQAGAITNLGRMLIYNCTVNHNTASAYGGAISNQHSMILEHTTISHNEAQGGSTINYGGGIVTEGDLTLINTTVSSNTATSSYGGGGIYVHSSGRVTITASTLTDNAAPWQGGGISTGGGPVFLQGTIVAANHGGDCSGFNITTWGYNLDSDDSCSLTTDKDLPDRDPLLGSLQDNGGNTPTHALLPNSPAIDSAACLDSVTSDQRAQPRPNPVSPFCDIGAYESSRLGVADLAVDKSSVPVLFLRGQVITYTIAFSNAGPANAMGVVITDIIPASITVRSIATAGLAISDTGVVPGYVWVADTMTRGARGAITITGEISVDLPSGATLVNTATIKSDSTDLIMSNNESVALITAPYSIQLPLVLKNTH
jgi:uncharacterized repeat protein (TIGR01451 family)/CSLREA domain-containing protein